MLLRHQLLQQIISVAELFDQILQANFYFSCFCTSFLFHSQHQTETGHLKNTPSANRTWAFGLALALAGAFTTGFVGACGAWTDAENASGVRGSKWATDAVTDNLNPLERVDLVSMIWFPFYGDLNSNASRDLRQKLKRLSSWWLNAAHLQTLWDLWDTNRITGINACKTVQQALSCPSQTKEPTNYVRQSLCST